ncbi:hypothetical protein JB92DRAFT_2830896 [Gautieria morchelliformis]|nr:hypothetical protein JB92DRAFT_2830896 [Gautieria morchelliformis]
MSFLITLCLILMLIPSCASLARARDLGPRAIYGRSLQLVATQRPSRLHNGHPITGCYCVARETVSVWTPTSVGGDPTSKLEACCTAHTAEYGQAQPWQKQRLHNARWVFQGTCILKCCTGGQCSIFVTCEVRYLWIFVTHQSGVESGVAQHRCQR